MTLFEKISSTFRRKEESFNIVDTDINLLKQEFSDSNYLSEDCLSEFPTIVSLINYDVKAAYALILLDDISYIDISNCLINKIKINIEDVTLNEVIKVFVGNYKYFIKIERNFNGLIFNLITDDQILLDELINMELQPPPPWIATYLEPKDFVFPQGKEEYYWNTFWLRFYEKLDPIELENYLNKYDVPSKWLEYFKIDHNKSI